MQPKMDLIEDFAKLSSPKWALVTGIMLSLAILLKPVDTSDFIYFRFN